MFPEYQQMYYCVFNALVQSKLHKAPLKMKCVIWCATNEIAKIKTDLTVII